MNKAITDGLVLMPPPFSAGLTLWSRENGTAGSGSYQGQANAAYVPADAGFRRVPRAAEDAERAEAALFRSRSPFQPGMYLRVTARVKALSGNLPTVRIAGYAGERLGRRMSLRRCRRGRR